MPPHSCDVPGRKPGTSTNVTSGTLNASQVRTNRAAFSDASMSSTPASERGWLPTTPTEWPPRRAKPTTMFSAQPLVHLEELAVVDDAPDDVVHVVRLVRVVRDERVELGILAVDRVGRRRERRASRGCSAAGTRAGSARPRGTPPRRGDVKCATPDFAACVAAPPSSSNVDLLARHRLDDVGAGDEHVRRALDHEDEVGDRGRVHGAAGARPHDEADLRDRPPTPARCARRSPRSRRARRRPPGCARRPSR